MTCALEAGRSRSRSARATLISQRGMVPVGRRPQVVVPAGRGHPGAVPARAGQPLVRSTAPRSGSPFAWRCRAAPPRRRLAGGSGQVSTGACQAPQTTAIRSRPRRRAARMVCRMYASRRRSLGLGGLEPADAARPSPRSAAGTARRSPAGTRPGPPTSARGRRTRPPRPGRPAGPGPGRRGRAASVRRIVEQGATAALRRQHHRGRQVAEPHLDAVLDRPDHRLPLRARTPRTARRRRPSARRPRTPAGPAAARIPSAVTQPMQRVGVGRALDQHRVRLVLLQRRAAASGPSPVRGAGCRTPGPGRRRRSRRGGRDLQDGGGHDTSRQAS